MTAIYRLRKSILLQSNAVCSELNVLAPLSSVLFSSIRTVFNKIPASKKDEKSNKFPQEPLTAYNSSKSETRESMHNRHRRFQTNYKKYETIKKDRNVIQVKAISKKDESDVFGNLSEKRPIWIPDVLEEESSVDNDLSDDSTIVKNISKQFRCPKDYLSRMKCLVGQKKIKDALDLFVDMRKNLVTPTHAQYTFMIGACGRVGYTEMAFKLLKQMTDRSLQPTPAVLTGLFNSCAETPFPEYGLKKAQSLKKKIEMKNWQLNQISYHAMIKAFGKCGDLLTAFQIVDEMVDAQIKIDVQTYSFLLMSCINNKDAGFTYAIEVWRKMKQKKCFPNAFTCNLLLRAVRDCDIGNDEISNLLLQHWSSYSKRPYGFVTKEEMQSLSDKKILSLDSNNQETIDQCNINKNEKISSSDTKDTYTAAGDPLLGEKENTKFELEKILNVKADVQKSESSVRSLLTARPLNGPEILELVDIKTASDRLSLIGGMEGFLKFMFKSKLKPNIKTLTLLLECLPPNIEEEEKLLKVLDTRLVKPDVDFFNILIKRRNMRKETEAARNVLILLNKYELAPDIVTFGVLALGCRTLNQANVFVDEMKKFGSYPNIEIAGAMLRNACCIIDFEYMKFVLKLMEQEHINPNEKVLLKLEGTLAEVKKNVIAMEQGQEVYHLYKKKDLPTNFTKFGHFYFDWLRRMRLDAEMHPWEQYRTDIIDRAKREEYFQV